MTIVNIQDFTKAIAPRRRKRRDLYEAGDQINELKSRGYSIAQICDFLKLNGIDITAVALQKFVSRNLKK